MARPLLPALALAALAAALLPAAASAADWRAVPGTVELAVDLESVRHDGQRVSGWLRWPGRAPWLPAATSTAPRIHRSTVLMEFDCGRRTLRALAANGQDGDGRPVLMATLGTPAQPVQGGDLAWAYDALCEAARAGQRL